MTKDNSNIATTNALKQQNQLEYIEDDEIKKQEVSNKKSLNRSLDRQLIDEDVAADDENNNKNNTSKIADEEQETLVENMNDISSDICTNKSKNRQINNNNTNLKNININRKNQSIKQLNEINRCHTNKTTIELDEAEENPELEDNIINNNVNILFLSISQRV